MAVDAGAKVPLRQHAKRRIEALRTERQSYWQHWRECANFVLPRRYKWLVTANESNKGSPINQMILDATGTLAARNLAAGMMAGIVSPARPWFKLRIASWSSDEADDVSRWLAEVQNRMLRVFAESNFYGSTAVALFDLVVFGTSCQIEYEDFDDVVRFYNPCIGEYFLAVDSKGRVDTIGREFPMTIAQVYSEFGKDNCSENVRAAYERCDYDREIIVLHLIEPNTEVEGRPGKHYQWRELYWEKDASEITSDGSPAPWLRKVGYREWPAQCPRWDVNGNDAYGRSPAMDALSDIKQLQQETKRKGQSLDKLVNPPMLFDAQLRNQPSSLLPGGSTYVANLAANTGARPLYQVQPPLGEMSQDIMEVQKRIRDFFYNDLFLMISQLDTVRSAAEIEARREEKMIMLGPVLERIQSEHLSNTIDRTFNIMLRAGLFPPPPEQIQGRPIEVQYISVLAETQRAVGLSGLERLAAMVGNLSAVRPDVLDTMNFDEFVTEYATLLGVQPKVLFDMEAIMAMREQRAQQVAQEQAKQDAGAAAAGAKVLSETDVGGGQNALQTMLYGGMQ